MFSVLNTTEFVLKMTGSVLNMNGFVLKLTGFDFFVHHMGPAQPGLLV